MSARFPVRLRLMAALAAVALLCAALTACASGEGARNLAVHDSDAAAALVNFFIPMEKASPYADDTARTEYYLTMPMAKDQLGLTLVYKTYTAEDYENETHDLVCLNRLCIA